MILKIQFVILNLVIFTSLPELVNLVQGYIITYAKKETEDSHVFGYG